MVQQKLDLPRLFFFHHFIFREVKKAKSETASTVVHLNKSRLFHAQPMMYAKTIFVSFFFSSSCHINAHIALLRLMEFCQEQQLFYGGLLAGVAAVSARQF